MSSSNIIKTLHEREWIRVVGHRDVPGRPAMYATTRDFLDYFNLKNLDQLPALAEIRDFDTLTEELGFDPIPELQPQPVAEGDGPADAVPEQAEGAEPEVAEAAAANEEPPVDQDVESAEGEEELSVTALREAAEDATRDSHG